MRLLNTSIYFINTLSSIVKGILAFSLFGFMACQSSHVYVPPTVKFTLSESQLPAYEKTIDHKGLINTVQKNTDESFRKGQMIYNKVCFTCHGNPVQEGSIPKAFKYWKDKFKVGNDPYSIYQTLTRGYGSMPAQTHLTPIEKYEVIHYIREDFLLNHNKDEYFEIDSAYLGSIPVGNSKGPDPVDQQAWTEMDYGNFLINTYELVDSVAAPREISPEPSPLKDENSINANY